MSITTVKATFDGQEYTLTFNETTRKYEAVIVPSKTSHNEEGRYFNTEITATNDKGFHHNGWDEYPWASVDGARGSPPDYSAIISGRRDIDNQCSDLCCRSI